MSSDEPTVEPTQGPVPTGSGDIDLAGSVPSGAKALLPAGEVKSLTSIFESASPEGEGGTGGLQGSRKTEQRPSNEQAGAVGRDKPRRLVKEGTITQWMMAQIAKAILDLGIEPDSDQVGQLEDAVWQTALSGRLGDGQVSDETAKAIFEMIQQLSANMPRISPETEVEPEDLLPPGDKLADLPEPDEEPPPLEPEEEPTGRESFELQKNRHLERAVDVAYRSGLGAALRVLEEEKP